MNLDACRRQAAMPLSAWAAVLVLLSGSAGSTQGDVLERTRTYVEAYERRLQYLIADEVSEQTVAPADHPDRPRERRVTSGEMFLTFLPAERHWTVVHDVAIVDGLPVDVRADLTALGRAAAVQSVARRVFALNARYNIGPVERNFNDPLLVLLALNDRHRSRFRFSRGAAIADAEDTLTTLEFLERDRPTLIRNRRGGPVYSRGELVVAAATGTIRRGAIRVEHDGTRAELVTEFVFDPRMDMWLPSEFRERYASDRDGQSLVTTCVSRYSNYRRFEVTGRIVR